MPENNSGGSGNSDGNNQSGTGSNQGGGDANQNQGQGLTYDAWVAQQPEDVRGLLEGHTSGLKSALESERTARKDFEKKIKELSGKAEKGSELEKQLAEIARTNELVQSQADFYEQAHAAGVSNLKLGFIVAQQEGFIDAKGRVNFDEMRKRFPELFGATQRAAGNAGAGTGNGAGGNSPGQRMNDFIRGAAGRK